MYREWYLSKIGATLAGRDALAAYGLMPADDALTWIENDIPYGKIGAIYFVEKSKNPTIVDGKKCSSKNKALVDFMEYPYDASAFIGALELLTPEEKQSLDHYIVKNNKLSLCRDARWKGFFRDILEKEENGAAKDFTLEDAERLLALNHIEGIKFSLNLTLADKRLKDLVSLMNTLDLYFAHGIEKAILLDMIDNKSKLEGLTFNTMKDFFAQAKTFRAVNITPKRIDTYISDFFSMISGLVDETVPKSFAFCKGYWKHKSEFRQAEKSRSATKKDALGFIELYLSFVMYQQKVNGYAGDLKSFIAENLTEEGIQTMLKDAEFAANMLRGKTIYGLCHKYNMPWKNLNWVNTFRQPEEAKAVFEEAEKYSGNYPQKIYAWAHSE